MREIDKDKIVRRQNGNVVDLVVPGPDDDGRPP
jgi:hypothetical protein